MASDRVFIDPLLIKETDCPIIVFAIDLRPKLFSWGIKLKTRDSANHVMGMTKPLFLESQGLVQFGRIPIESYLKSDIILEFWRIRNLTTEEKNRINDSISNRLNLNFLERGYDALGIFGQMTGLKFIQNPKQFFCSEQIRQDHIKPILRADRIIDKYPSPGDMRRKFIANQEVFERLGYFLKD